MQSLGKDRRLAARHLLKVPLRLRRSQQCERSVQAENAWRRGVFFTTHIPMDEDTLLALLSEMPGKFQEYGRCSGCAWTHGTSGVGWNGEWCVGSRRGIRFLRGVAYDHA